MSCKNAKEILSKARKEYGSSRTEEGSSTRSSDNTKAKKITKAAFVELGTDDEDDDSGSVEARSVSVHAANASENVNIDSGCGKSMTPYGHHLTNAVPKRITVRLAEDSVIKSTHVGNFSLPVSGGPSHKMLLIPNLQEALLSVSQLCDDGNVVCFTSTGCSIFSDSHLDLSSLGRPVGVGERRGNLYYLPNSVGAFSTSTTTSGSDGDSLLLWHQRLGHIGLKPLKSLLKSCHISPRLFNELDVQKCPICVQSKMHRLKFSTRSSYRSTTKGELIHSDVCSFEEQSREGFHYWITFIDDFSKETTAYPLKSKDQSFQSFLHFKAMFKKSGDFTIKELRSDNGGEYMNGPFLAFLLGEGIKHEPGPPHSPELNGVAEQANRTICEKV